MSKKVQKESKKMQKQQALKAQGRQENKVIKKQAKIPFLFWDFIASFRLEIKR